MPETIKEILGEERYSGLKSKGQNCMFFNIFCSKFSQEDLLVVIGFLAESNEKDKKRQDELLNLYADLGGL